MNKKAIITILILIALIIIVPLFFRPKDAVAPVKEEAVNEILKDTYTYTNHGFSIELPKGFTPKEEQPESGVKMTIISLPQGTLMYYPDASIWEKESSPARTYIKDQKIGGTTFKLYEQKYNFEAPWYNFWFKQGKVGYLFVGHNGQTGDYDANQLETFKFIGWPQVGGNKDDLVSFSIQPGEEVNGNFTEKEYTGVIKGGYFFEANILVNILDSNKKLLRSGHASASTDWMTVGPVSFQGFLNLSNLPKGKAYIEIHNDNPSGLPENDKSILIPIVIK